MICICYWNHLIQVIYINRISLSSHMHGIPQRKRQGSLVWDLDFIASHNNNPRLLKSTCGKGFISPNLICVGGRYLISPHCPSSTCSQQWHIYTSREWFTIFLGRWDESPHKDSSHTHFKKNLDDLFRSDAAPGQKNSQFCANPGIEDFQSLYGLTDPNNRCSWITVNSILTTSWLCS